MIRTMVVGRIILLAGVVGLVTTLAVGGKAPVGSLVGSKDAILDGQVPLPHTTVLSGDNLHVADGLAMVALEHGNRMILGRSTEVSFSKEAGGVLVTMVCGNLSLYHPEASKGFRVKVGDVTVAPAKGFRTVGEVATADGLLLVTAKNGTLQVERDGATREVDKGKTITIPTKAARARTSNPAAKRHLKHIFSISPKRLLILGGAAEAAGTITAIVLSRSSAPSVSPIMPTP